ncbi:MAG TPA: glycosyltransferase family 39 protein [Pyrinomonadaceae bacterium]
MFLLLAAAFALLWRLGAGSLAAWDEAIYAQVSKEAALSGDWLTPHWGYRPWFEKPPLFVWVTALLYRLFGVGEFSARAPSALSGVALVGVTYLVGKQTCGRLAGLLAGAVLLTCYHFLSFSRFGTTDVMLALFTYVAVYAYLRSEGGGGRWWYLVWASCGLALMVKGAGGLVAPGAVVLALAFDRRLGAAVRSGGFWRGVALGLLVAAPWHVLMSVRYGRGFLEEYIGYHVVARTTRALEGHPSGYLYYVGVLLDGFFPWCLPAPFALVSAVRGSLRDRARSWVLPTLCALVFGAYTLIPTRRPWYVLPLYPALAVLVAAFAVKLFRGQHARPARRRLLAAACAALAVVGGVYCVASLNLNRRPEEPAVRLSRLARSRGPGDRDPLVVLHGVEPIQAQVPLFYSDRPVRQAYVKERPAGEDARRYVNFESLADVAGASEQRIILRREDVEPLSADYIIRTLAEDGPLAYAAIRRR